MFRQSRQIGSRRRFIALCAITGVVATSLTGCATMFPSAPVTERVTRSTNSVPLRIGKAIRADLNGVLNFAGEVQAKGTVLVVPRVASQLDRFYVDVGSRVREGEPLAELNRADLEVRVLEAQSAQAAAEARLALIKSNPKPEAVAQAQANLRAAQARLKALENSRQGNSDPSALQQRANEARAQLDQLQASTQPNQQAISQADAALQQARNKLNSVLADPARANDRAAVDAAREEARKAEEAANNARRPSGTVGTSAQIEQARRDLQDADQAVALARLSFNAFDLDQARALVESADAQVKLVGAPATPDEIKAAESAVEQAFAVAELARIRLRDATVVAPIAGVVTELQANPGTAVGPTAPILTMIPPELQVTVQAEEGQAAQIQPGQAVNLSVESLPQDSFTGVVKAVAPVLDPRTRMVSFKVEVPDPKGKLRPGMFTQLAVQTAQRQGAVLVPKDAVIRVAASAADASAPQQTAVFVVVDSRVRRQRVQLGPSDARNVEVLQGLTEGTDVVLSPRADLIDGEQIVTAP